MSIEPKRTEWWMCRDIEKLVAKSVHGLKRYESDYTIERILASKSKKK